VTTGPAKTALAARLEKLGIRSKLDLVLHLPLRYEDETRLTPLKEARAGTPVLVEAEVVESDVKYRPRRTLVVKLTDGASELWVRFLNFYPSQVKQLAPGKWVRLFGEVRPGFFGDEMVHPRYKVVAPGTPLPTSLTPVYPTTAGLSQSALRGMIERALEHLIENAAKYSPADSLIEVRAERERGEVRLAVTDNGVGLSREERNRIWERFYRSPRLRERIGGSGLGLWIAQALVAACQGRAEASIRRGEPAGFLSDGVLYVLLGVSDPKVRPVLFASTREEVTLTGILVNQNGLMNLNVTGIQSLGKPVKTAPKKQQEPKKEGLKKE